MAEPLRAVQLFAVDGPRIYVHLAPTIGRVAEIWHDHKLYEEYPLAIATELEERGGAIRAANTWQYDDERHCWTRFERTLTGGKVRYYFRRDADGAVIESYDVQEESTTLSA